MVYAKAEARAAAHKPQAEPPPEIRSPPAPSYAPPNAVAAGGPFSPSAGLPLRLEGDESELERRLRLFVLPAALVGAWLLVTTSAGRAFGRIFFSMWIHELGHAVAAWLCGFHAVPLPWFTPVADRRSFAVWLMLAALLGFLGWKAWRAERRGFALAMGALLLIQAACTVGLGLPRARALIIFGGDAGCLVLGSALMLTFYSGPHNALRTRGLRWGFLAIGAIAFMDPFEQWWGSLGNSDRIAYGISDRSGLSDASKLTETFGWSESWMVHAYVALGIACLVLLAGSYLLGLWKAGWLPPRARRR